MTFPGRARPWVTGGPALFFDLNQASTESLRSGELIALPVPFAILLLVFRSVVAALLPVLVATLGVISTLGILSFFADVMHITFHGCHDDAAVMLLRARLLGLLSSATNIKAVTPVLVITFTFAPASTSSRATSQRSREGSSGLGR